MEKDNNRDEFPIQTYSLKELAKHYRVSTRTFKRYLQRLNLDLGTRLGNVFSPKQVRIIVDNLGKPFIWIAVALTKAFTGVDVDGDNQPEQEDGLAGKK